MAAQLDNHNRWNANPNTFAATVQVNDVPGFFSRQLVIEPGTRAFIIDQGNCLGEVPPGAYELESFDERLQFWLRKQATAILARQEDFPLEITYSNVPTAENLVVTATVRIIVQIEDASAFLRNLMGTRKIYSADEMTAAVSPLVQQALWESVGRMSITDLTSASVRNDLDASIGRAVNMSMKRYGLQFVHVQTVSIHHEKYDEHRRKLGDAWLLKEGLEQTRALDALYTEEELLRIKRLERDNELALLAENVEVARMESDVAVKSRRIEVRNRLRDAIQSEEFDKIETAEEMEKFVQQRDKQRLLRDEEVDQLREGFQQRKGDRVSARSHLVAMLDLERKLETDTIREDIDHAMKMKRIEHEIEVARQVRSKENQAWEVSLERERAEANHRHHQRSQEFDQQRQLASKGAQQRREDEWDDLVHEQKSERIKAELETSRQENHNRLGRLQSELKQSLENEQFETEKRRQQWELEVAQKKSGLQLDRLSAVQKLNHESAQRQFELHERRQRIDLELAELKDDKAHGRELSRIEALKNLGTEALVATANTANAALLADMKKHEATQQAILSQADILRNSQLDAERAKMFEKLSDTEKAKADAIAAAYREAMKSQQENVQQMIASLGSIGQQRAASQQPMIVIPPTMPGQPTLVNTPVNSQSPLRVRICSSCQTENSDTAKFCSGCGTRIQ